jgi:hypothetical protein
MLKGRQCESRGDGFTSPWEVTVPRVLAVALRSG